MLHKLIKPFIGLCLIFVTYNIGNRVYLYYTHTQAPVVTVEGLKQDGFYKGTIDAKVVANNRYKIATIDAMLDEKPFTGINPKVSSRSFSNAFTINTEQLEDGEHTLHLHATDASKQKNQSDTTILFHVDNKPLSASFIETNYRIDQGKTAHIKIQTNKPVEKITLKTFNKTFQCNPETPSSSTYECFIPIDCEESPARHDLIAEVIDHVGQSAKLSANLEILHFNFPKQKGFSVNAEKLAEEKSISVSNNVLSEAINKWAAESPQKKLWHGKFEIPMQVRRMTTPFGEVRVTPECGRYMHRGVDLVNMPRSIVWATQNGKVIIKDRFTMTGNTIVLDHGLGVMTVYAHLDSFADIEVGDTLKKGHPVGKVGMTGYANGYHLHWELRINGIAVDPLEWTEKVY
jgi:hypothetical protein